MIDLNKLYGKKYRMFMDEAWYIETAESNPDKMKDRHWYYEIRGKYGKIYLYGVDKLAVMITANRIKSRIKTEYKDILSLYLEAEDESIFLFDPEYFEVVAKIIKAKKKRQITDEQRYLIIERTKKYRFQRSTV
jgi:site-specific DNA-adenine methylase